MVAQDIIWQLRKGPEGLVVHPGGYPRTETCVFRAAGAAELPRPPGRAGMRRPYKKMAILTTPTTAICHRFLTTSCVVG